MSRTFSEKIGPGEWSRVDLDHSVVEQKSQNSTNSCQLIHTDNLTIIGRCQYILFVVHSCDKNRVRVVQPKKAVDCIITG